MTFATEYRHPATGDTVALEYTVNPDGTVDVQDIPPRGLFDDEYEPDPDAAMEDAQMRAYENYLDWREAEGNERFDWI